MPVASLLLAALRFAPVALDAGIAIKDLVTQVSGKAQSSPSKLTEVERYAANVLQQVPMLLDAGKDVSSILAHGNEQVAAMIKEHRNPTPAERAELDAKIDAVLRDINSQS